MSIQPLPAKMEVYPMRIPPGGEVTSLLQQAVSDLGLNAPFIVSCVGSVKSVILRFATDGHGKHAVSERNENLEICSLVGTLSKDGFHLHGTFGNAQGVTLSGHIMGNMVVQTTAEIVLGNAFGFEFRREFDSKTGFNELVVKETEEEKSNIHRKFERDVKAGVDQNVPLSKNVKKEAAGSGGVRNSSKEETALNTPAFPTDEEIKTYVTKVLEGANLEEITMKTVLKRVYENYPGHDLSHKKDLIKETVQLLV